MPVQPQETYKLVEVGAGFDPDGSPRSLRMSVVHKKYPESAFQHVPIPPTVILYVLGRCPTFILIYTLDQTRIFFPF